MVYGGGGGGGGGGDHCNTDFPAKFQVNWPMG